MTVRDQKPHLSQYQPPDSIQQEKVQRVKEIEAILQLQLPPLSVVKMQRNSRQKGCRILDPVKVEDHAAPEPRQGKRPAVVQEVKKRHDKQSACFVVNTQIVGGCCLTPEEVAYMCEIASYGDFGHSEALNLNGEWLCTSAQPGCEYCDFKIGPFVKKTEV